MSWRFSLAAPGVGRGGDRDDGAPAQNEVDEAMNKYHKRLRQIGQAHPARRA